MYTDLHAKYVLFLSDFNQTSILSTDVQKIFKYQFSQRSVQWEPSCSMPTARQSEANSQICNFVNTPNNVNTLVT